MYLAACILALPLKDQDEFIKILCKGHLVSAGRSALKRATKLSNDMELLVYDESVKSVAMDSRIQPEIALHAMQLYVDPASARQFFAALPSVAAIDPTAVSRQAVSQFVGSTFSPTAQQVSSFSLQMASSPIAAQHATQEYKADSTPEPIVPVVASVTSAQDETATAPLDETDSKESKHDDHSSDTPAEFDTKTVQDGQTTVKDKNGNPCRFFLVNRCTRGDECKYAHLLPEQLKPCRYTLAGKECFGFTKHRIPRCLFRH